MAAQQRDLSKATGGEPEAVRIWLLGGFRVSVGASRSIGDDGWRLRKADNLVKMLALAGEHRLHREQATGLLWPDLDPQAAANNLHHAHYVARHTLEPSSPSRAVSSYLQLRDERLALCPDGPLWVDVGAFEEAAITARHGREAAAYRAALDLYSGELLPQDRYETWVEQRRAELRELYLSLLVELAALYEERGEHEPAIEALSGVVAKEPKHEDAHVGLMRLYALSGRRREALGQYERLREALYRELGTEPEATSTLLQQEIWTGAFPPALLPPAGSPPQETPSATGAVRHNLPRARDTFVGRERETREVRRLLAMTGLLTLTGAGGSGKTRLALEVARGLVGAYPDGVWLVELAALSEAALVPQAVARALGVREIPGRSLEDTLADNLRPKRLVLVVDNCEHLIDPVAHLAQVLLSSCPNLRILATSREPLGIRGEAIWTVSPLSMPHAEGVFSVEEVAGTEAVRLFVDRAGSRLLGFELTESNAGAVSRICRKLDGIPLAIELAAARMGALAVEQVAQRLDNSLKLLTGGGRTAGPRQQTLRATLDWSHDLLSEAERRFFGRLSVFAGGFTLEAAEEVCSGEGIEHDAVVDLLSRLVDKSLVVAEASPGIDVTLRYKMLEPVRQYGHEHLEESGEADRVREVHARYYLALAEESRSHEPGLALKVSQPLEWLERMQAEHDNLRAALSWTLDREEATEPEAELGLRLAAALYGLWYTQNLYTEARRYLWKALSGRRNPATRYLRARALIGAGWMAITQGDFEEAKTLMEEGLALCRELGDREGIASALTELGLVAFLGERDDIPIAAVLEELMDLKPWLRNRSTLSYLLILEGAIAASRGDLERSATLHEESLELFLEMRDALGTGMCMTHLGLLELLRADYERAASLLREVVRQGWELDFKAAIQICLHGLGCVAACREHPIRAARLWGAVEGMHETYGVRLTPVTRSITGYESLLVTARSQLEEETWTGAWAEGKAMPLESAKAYALSEEEEPPTLVAGQQPPADEPTERLTSRELEVAVLVARGHTNRRIASELSISGRTAENHLGKIFRKLGLHSRSQLAAWTIERRLLAPDMD